MQCIQFCMQMPGNSELSIQERAHLLKLGVHEVALLRLAYRYEHEDDKLYLSNGLSVDEHILMTQAFGCYGHTFLQFCRIFSRLELTIEEFVLLCCIVFYSHGRDRLEGHGGLTTSAYDRSHRRANDANESRSDSDAFLRNRTIAHSQDTTAWATAFLEDAPAAVQATSSGRVEYVHLWP